MKTPLACLNLLHNRVRTAVAIAGVTFAVVLMFMQLGFLQAVIASAEIVYDDLNFDICIRSKDYLLLSDARSFPAARLHQIEGVEGVREVIPCDIGLQLWRIPREMPERTLMEQMLSITPQTIPGAGRSLIAQQGEKRSVLVIGVRRGDRVFKDQATHESVQQHLLTPEHVVIDTTTRPEYGAKNSREFGPEDVGEQTEINGQRVIIGGLFTRGSGLAASGTVIINERGFDRLILPSDRERVTLGLVNLKPNTDGNAVAAYLNKTFPDVEAVTREKVIKDETEYWTEETNYGLIFRTGVVIALIVGTAIVYQVLASDISSLLPEYATLKAMGYGNAYLSRVVLQQAILLAVMSLIPGWLIAVGLYALTSSVAAIPVQMTLTNVLFVCVLTLAMCSASGIAAMRKAFQAEPAELF